MTLWAHTVEDFQILWRLWDVYLAEDNVYLHHFVALSLLISNRDEIFKGKIELNEFIFDWF